MNRDNIKKALEICNDADLSCGDCSYHDDLTCSDTLRTDARELIIKQEQEIEELRNEKWDAQDDLDCYYDEMPSKIKQAVQDFAEKLKAKAETFLVAKGDGVYGEKPYVSVDKIDELLKEYE